MPELRLHVSSLRSENMAINDRLKRKPCSGEFAQTRNYNPQGTLQACGNRQQHNLTNWEDSGKGERESGATNRLNFWQNSAECWNPQRIIKTCWSLTSWTQNQRRPSSDTRSRIVRVRPSVLIIRPGEDQRETEPLYWDHWSASEARQLLNHR